jgi:hypothetical protein
LSPAAGLPVAVALALAIALLACERKEGTEKRGALPPLSASSWLAALDVPEFGMALASVPLGARTPRPVLIAIHGDADRPEWQCGSYRHVTRRKAFVLCPRGVLRADQRFTLGTPADTARELREALPVLKARFGAHVAAGAVVLAGLGPSVEHAIDLALKEPSFFSYLLLVDGSVRRFDLPAMARFGQAGGRRVLVVCSVSACDTDVEARLSALKPAGVATRVVHVERGRGLDTEMVARLQKEFAWLVAKDARWQ